MHNCILFNIHVYNLIYILLKHQFELKTKNKDTALSIEFFSRQDKEIHSILLNINLSLLKHQFQDSPKGLTP